MDEASSNAMNDALARDPDWWGNAKVAISAAHIDCRFGEFEAEPDILYKRTHFEPAAGSSAMTDDIVDVRKAKTLWLSRYPYLEKAVGSATLSSLRELHEQVEKVAAAEYYVHEAGHCIGYPTAHKYSSGYFRVEGKTLWPLVYVEELRADLLGFGIAANLFSPELASKIFWYNVLLRLGTQAEHVAGGRPEPYGPIPLMLISCLNRFGLLRLNESLERGMFEFTATTPEATVQAMVSIGSMARNELVEQRECSPTDAAIQAARFYQTVHRENGDLASLFEANAQSLLRSV